jgi:hypothetical protein
MRNIGGMVAIGVTALWAAACSTGSSRPQVDLMDRSRDIFLLLRYDANNDRQITRDEVTAGVKKDYAAADTNHDGKLSPDEVQAENQRRWTQEGPQSSPLMDWNMDGNVSEDEFAGAVRSLFTTVDRDKDNIVTVEELRAPRITAPPPRPQIQPQTGGSQPPTR